MFRVDGRVAVVTGASSGLGERFARVLEAAGASVIVAARRADRLKALAEESPNFVPVTCDVTAPDDVEALVATTIGRFGRIDILVNNAGISDPMLPAVDEDPADFRRVMEVNLFGPHALARLVARHMVAARTGSIVNVASVLGFVASAPIYATGYCASKGAIISLTRELAVQLARKGVRVNALAPGWFESEMTGELIDSESGADYLKRNCPMNRVGAPDELDGALLFLASDASSFVTGQTLVVDGGWTAR